jgi:hypothetical protein
MIAKSKSAEPRLICPITGTPCRAWSKPKTKPTRNRKAMNGKTPRWALSIDQLKAEFVPIWERENPPKRRQAIKAGEVAAWIAAHPDWVAGRLVSKPMEAVYFSYIKEAVKPNERDEVRFSWVFDGQRKVVEQRLGFVEFATFAEWKKAQKPKPQ